VPRQSVLHAPFKQETAAVLNEVFEKPRRAVPNLLANAVADRQSQRWQALEGV